MLAVGRSGVCCLAHLLLVRHSLYVDDGVEMLQDGGSETFRGCDKSKVTKILYRPIPLRIIQFDRHYRNIAGAMRR